MLDDTTPEDITEDVVGLPSSVLLTPDKIKDTIGGLGDNFSPAFLGGKAYHVARMMADGLPVPPAVVLPVPWQHAHEVDPETIAGELENLIPWALSRLGQVVGHPHPLVSVRSGAPVSMPGMMDTVLNVGLTDDTLPYWAEKIEPRPTVDSLRRLIQMYGTTVDGIDSAMFESILSEVRAESGVATDAELSVDALIEVADRFSDLYREQTSLDFPQDSTVQVRECVQAVWRSWHGDRARRYRDHHGISHDMGTAVLIQAMVFGNSGPDSGSGVAFTRDPSTGENCVVGEFLPNAQGEDVVAGTRTPLPLHELPHSITEQLVDIGTKLETTYRDMMDLEFTVDQGKLWMLQCRVAKRTARAAFVTAVDLLTTGDVTLEEAASRVTFQQWLAAQRPAVDPTSQPAATGLPASPGAVSGVLVTTSAGAVKMAAKGVTPVLVRPETTPDDIEGMLVAGGILTARGGITSHAAVVARSLDVPAVVGCPQIEVTGAHARVAGVSIAHGDIVTICGTTGRVWTGAQPVKPAGCTEADDLLAYLIESSPSGQRPYVRCSTAQEVDATSGYPWVVAWADRSTEESHALWDVVQKRLNQDTDGMVVIDFQPGLEVKELGLASLMSMGRFAAASFLAARLSGTPPPGLSRVRVVPSGFHTIDDHLSGYDHVAPSGKVAENLAQVLQGVPVHASTFSEYIGGAEAWAKVKAALAAAGLPYGEASAEPRGLGRSELARLLLAGGDPSTLQETDGG